MPILRRATAGTMQSSDLMVVVEPAGDFRLEIESTVKKQYEHLIRERIETTLRELGVASGHFRISDRGALDYAISARIQAAVQRASQE